MKNMADGGVQAETQIHGRVSAVYLRLVGSPLAADVGIGDGTVTVEDPYDFDEAGGTALVGAETLTYTAVDYDAGVLTLSGTAASTHSAGDFVQVDTAGLAVETRAVVEREGYDGGDADARVPHRWQDVLTEGVRDGGAGEAVTLQFDAVNSEYYVLEILGQDMVVDGSYIDGSTITGVTATAGTDGSVPSASPDVAAVYGGALVLEVRWNAVANADPVTYKVYMDTADPGSTPSSGLLVGETSSLSLTVTRTAGGVALAYGTTYYFRIVASDGDGDALAAGAGGNAAPVKPTYAGVDSDGGTPGTPSVSIKQGPGWVQATWAAVTGTQDPLLYKVFAKIGSAPSTSGTTDLVATTPATTLVISKMPDGTTVTDLTTVHVRVVAVSAVNGDAGSASTDQSAAALALDGSVYTISNLQAGNISAGDIAAERMEANFLTAAEAKITKLSAVTGNMGTLTAGLITVGNANANRAELDSDGFRLYSTDGLTKLVWFPTNRNNEGLPNYFSGQVVATEVDAQTMSVSTSALLGGGSELSVASGVAAPLNSPAVSLFWDNITLGAGDSGSAHQGLAYDTVHGRLATLSLTGNKVKVFSATDGSVVTQVALDATITPIGVASLVVSGTCYLYVLGRQSGSLKIWQYAITDLTTILSTTTITMTGGTGIDAIRGFGSDGTNLFVVDASTTSSTAVIKVWKYAVTAGVPASTATTTTTSGTGNPTFDVISSVQHFDFTGFTDPVLGAATWLVSEAITGKVYSFDATGAYQQNHDFPGANGTSTDEPWGVANDGTYVWTVPQNNVAVRHSVWDWTTQSSKYWASFAYRSRNKLRTTNLADMETDTTGFAKLVGTEALTGAETTHGAATAADSLGVAALKIVTAATISSGVRIGSTTSDCAPVVPGVAHSAQLYVWGNAGTEALGLSIEWRDSSGSLLSTSTETTFTAGTSWGQHKVENIVAPAGAAFASLKIRTTAATAMTFWIDAAQLESATACTAWVQPAETIISPRAALTMQRRAKLAISLPVLPTGADKMDIYLNRGSSDPGGGSGSVLQYTGSGGSGSGGASGLGVTASTTVPTFTSSLVASPASQLGAFSTVSALIVSAAGDTSGTPYWKIDGAGTIRFLGPTMQNQFWLYEEFSAIDAAMGSNLIGPSGMCFSSGSAGTSAPSGTSGTPAFDHPGIGTLATGNGTAAFATFRTSTSFCRIGLATYRLSCLIQVPTLSTSTDTFFVGFGLADSTDYNALSSISGNASIMFRYTHGTISGHWQVCNSNSGGVDTANGDTGVAVNAGQWYFLEFEVDSSGKVISWWIDGGASGSGVITGTQMPTNTNNLCMFVTIKKSGGTNSRSINVDTMSLFGRFV